MSFVKVLADRKLPRYAATAIVSRIGKEWISAGWFFNYHTFVVRRLHLNWHTDTV